MDFKIKKFRKFIFFCFVGATSALIDLTIFNLVFWLGLGFVISRVISIPSALVYNFFMNRNITFSAMGKSVSKQTLKYVIVYGLSVSSNFLISLGIVKLLGETTLIANIAIICGVLVSIPISFFGSLLWTFKK